MNQKPRDIYEMSLSEIRGSKKISREKISALTGLSEDTIYSIEKRRQIPRIDTAIAICKVLDLSLREFCHSIGLDVSDLKEDSKDK
jgi:DNA-binding XRE family transcriptional regulator